MPARFPTYERSVGLAGGSTGSYASMDAFAGPGRALGNVGDAVFGLGDEIAKGEAKIRETQDDTWLTKARAEGALRMIGAERDAQNAATDEAETYLPTVRTSFDEYRKETMAKAPSPRAARMFDQWATGYDVDLTARASKFQAESVLAKRTADFSDAMNAHAQAVFADPTQYDAVLKRAQDDFAGAKQWMNPEQEQIARDLVEKNLKLARAKSLVEFNPKQFLAEIGGQTNWRDAIASIESAGSGDYSAVGPTHSKLGRALGRYQIMEANIPSWSRAALGRSVTAEEFLANPQIQDAIFDHKFGGYVRQFGLEGAAQAWFAGPGGVGKTDRKDVLGTDVGSYGKKFLAALGGKGLGKDPRYAGLSVDEILSLQNTAQTAVDKENATLYASLKDRIDQGIATGQVMSEGEIIASGLNGGDVATMLGKFRTAQESGRNLGQAWADFQNGSLSLDSYDSKDRGLIDKMEASIPEGETAIRDAWANEAVRRTGIVPRGTVNGILRGLESSNPSDVAASAVRAMQITAIDPNALAKRDNGSTAQDAATAFDHYLNTVGLTQEEAARRLIDARDPEKVKARASLMESKPVKDFIKNNAVESTVRDIFDPGMFGFDPKLGTSEAEKASMIGEYRSILEESVFDAAGDQELAKTYAAQRFSRLYGPSPLTLSGDGVVTRLPPEKVYPAGPDGTHAYILEQLDEALTAEGVEFDEVFLQSDQMTDDDWRSNRPVRYQVFYRKGEDLERYNLPFFAIPPKQSAPTLDENRARRDQNRQDVVEGQDRQGNLDRFLEADPLTGR